MKIGAKVQFFNFKMREARARLGLSQSALGELCGEGIGINVIGQIERLGTFSASGLRGINQKLATIANVLETDFDVLFPQEYLDMLQQEKAPRMITSFLWVREISLDQLYDEGQNIDEFLLTDGEIQTTKDLELKTVMDRVLESLTQREKAVIDVRFGLSGWHPLSLEETGKAFGVTRERIRQIEGKALRRLRHPKNRRKLRDFLI